MPLNGHTEGCIISMIGPGVNIFFSAHIFSHIISVTHRAIITINNNILAVVSEVVFVL